MHQLLQTQPDAAQQIARQQCWQDTLMRLFLRSGGGGGGGGPDAISNCSLDLGRSGGGAARLDLPLERRGRAGSRDRHGGEEDRLSMGDGRSLDSLENGGGDAVSLLDTPSSAAATPRPSWGASGGRGPGGLTLDLSHVQGYEGGESGGSTPSPLDGAARAFPAPGAGGERDATPSLGDDSFLFSDTASLGESFNGTEVRRRGGGSVC